MIFPLNKIPELYFFHGIFHVPGMFRGKKSGRMSKGTRCLDPPEKKSIGAPSFLSLREISNSEEIQNFPGKFLKLPGTFRGKNLWKVEEGDQKFAPRKNFGSTARSRKMGHVRTCADTFRLFRNLTDPFFDSLAKSQCKSYSN